MRIGQGKARGFTLLEILMTVMILSIMATIAIEAVGNTESALRSERAAREAVTAIRFARARAMSDGVSYKVRFDVGNRTISVLNTSDVLVAAPMSGGVMKIDLSGQRDLSGVTMSVSLTGDSADPYDLTFASLGGTTNSGTVTFSYGGVTKVLQIPTVGDPTIVGDATRRP